MFFPSHNPLKVNVNSSSLILHRKKFTIMLLETNVSILLWPIASDSWSYVQSRISYLNNPSTGAVTTKKVDCMPMGDARKKFLNSSTLTHMLSLQ